MNQRSFLSQHKDTLQIVYGTFIAASMYFGITSKIDLVTQKHNDDMNMVEFRLRDLERKKQTKNENKNESEKEDNQYAILPKHIILNEED